MKHDADVGCDGREGFMSGTAGKWSRCSRKAVLDHYNSMKSAGKWCLAGNTGGPLIVPFYVPAKIGCNAKQYYERPTI